ncbi:unnamed protein product [Closterium sp. NIES-64]|nr:unnamed protein product [Closterium sp. NIES-64]
MSIHKNQEIQDTVACADACRVPSNLHVAARHCFREQLEGFDEDEFDDAADEEETEFVAPQRPPTRSVTLEPDQGTKATAGSDRDSKSTDNTAPDGTDSAGGSGGRSAGQAADWDDEEFEGVTHGAGAGAGGAAAGGKPFFWQAWIRAAAGAKGSRAENVGGGGGSGKNKWAADELAIIGDSREAAYELLSDVIIDQQTLSPLSSLLLFFPFSSQTPSLPPHPSPPLLLSPLTPALPCSLLLQVTLPSPAKAVSLFPIHLASCAPAFPSLSTSAVKSTSAEQCIDNHHTPHIPSSPQLSGEKSFPKLAPLFRALHSTDQQPHSRRSHRRLFFRALHFTDQHPQAQAQHRKVLRFSFLLPAGCCRAGEAEWASVPFFIDAWGNSDSVPRASTLALEAQYPVYHVTVLSFFLPRGGAAELAKLMASVHIFHRRSGKFRLSAQAKSKAEAARAKAAEAALKETKEKRQEELQRRKEERRKAEEAKLSPEELARRREKERMKELKQSAPRAKISRMH